MYSLHPEFKDYFVAVDQVLIHKNEDLQLVTIEIFERADRIIKDTVLLEPDDNEKYSDQEIKWLEQILEPLEKVILLYPIWIARHFMLTQPLFIYQGIGRLNISQVHDFWQRLKLLSSPLFVGQTEAFQYFQTWFAKVKYDPYFLELHAALVNRLENGLESKEILRFAVKDRWRAEQAGLAPRYANEIGFWTTKTINMLGLDI